jgi:hypothetical protein
LFRRSKLEPPFHTSAILSERASSEVHPRLMRPRDLGAGGLRRRSSTTEKVADRDATGEARRKAIDIALPPGNHEIEVTLRSAKELSIDWRGARQSNYRATAAIHRSSGVLEEKGGAVVDNPTFVESGETAIAKDRIVVRRIP